MPSPTRVGTDTEHYVINSGTGSSITFAHTVPSTGQNKTLCVVSMPEDAAFGDSFTWNGTAMTQVVNQSAPQNYRGRMWALTNPAVGTFNLVGGGNYTDGSRYGFVAFTLQDTVQSEATLIDVTDKAGNASGTSNAKSITTTVDNDLLIVWNILSSAASAETVTDDGSQTRIANHGFGSGAGGFVQMTVSQLAQASFGAQSMGYSWDVSSRNDLYVTSIKYLAPSSARSRLTLLGVA